MCLSSFIVKSVLPTDLTKAADNTVMTGRMRTSWRFSIAPPALTLACLRPPQSLSRRTQRVLRALRRSGARLLDTPCSHPERSDDRSFLIRNLRESAQSVVPSLSRFLAMCVHLWIHLSAYSALGIRSSALPPTAPNVNWLPWPTAGMATRRRNRGRSGWRLFSFGAPCV